MEQVKGIEPSTPAWEAGVLPLNYTCRRYNALGGTSFRLSHYTPNSIRLSSIIYFLYYLIKFSKPSENTLLPSVPTHMAYTSLRESTNARPSSRLMLKIAVASPSP